jgi:hypothetical protein
LDTHKAKIAVAVAEPGRSGEVRFRGEITNQPDAVRRLIERLGEKHGRLSVCYEASPSSSASHAPRRKATTSSPSLDQRSSSTGASAGP